MKTKNQKTLDQLIITNSLFYAVEIASLLIFSFPAVFLFWIGGSDLTVIIISLIIVVYLAIKFFYVKSNRQPQIIIDKKGIQLCEEGQFYHWNKVKYAFIQNRIERHRRKTRIIGFLHIVLAHKTVEKRMEDYAYSPEKVKQAIERYSGRDIGDKTDPIRDKIAETIKNREDANKVIQDFIKYKRQVIILAYLILPVMGASIYYQVHSSFPYIFAIGFTLYFLVLFLWSRWTERNFKRRRHIALLTPKLYKWLIRRFRIRYSKKSEQWLIGFWCALSVGLFFASYYLSQ